MKNKTTLKELIQVAWPLIVTNACFVIMQFTDRVMLARYSGDALAACVPAGSLAFTFVALFMGLAGYSGVFIAQYHGQKKKANLTLSLWQGIWVSLIAGGLILALTPVGLKIIELFNHAPQVQILEKEYFKILNWFGGFFVLNNALGAFFTGRGKTAQTMLITATGNIANIFFSYVLIFGKFGFKPYGIAGAAYGTILACLCITLCYTLAIFSARNRRRYRTGRLAGFHKDAFLRLLRFGVPNGFGFFMDILAFSMFSFITGGAGAAALQASSIAFSMQSVVFMPLLGLSIGTLILVGKYMGMKSTEQASAVTKNACKVGFAYSAFFAFLFLCFPHLFINIFMPEGASAQTAALAAPLVRIVALFTLGDTLYLIFGESIRGAGDTMFHMLAMLLSAWAVMMPGAFVIMYYFKGSIAMLWSWFTLYALFTGVIMWVRWYKGKWKTMDITA